MGIGLSGMISGLDTDSIVQAMVSKQKSKATKIENKITLNKWESDEWSSLNNNIYSFYTEHASKLRLQSTYNTKSASVSSNAVKAKASSNAAAGNHKLEVEQLASSQYLTGRQLTKEGKTANWDKNTKLSELCTSAVVGSSIEITTKTGTKKFEITDETTIGDFTKACEEAGLQANFDERQQRLFISSKDSGEENAFTLTSTKLTIDDVETNVSTLLGLDDLVKNDKGEVITSPVNSDTESSALVNAKDAIVKLDGATIRETTNNFSVNGLSLEIVAKTTEPVNIAVSNDADNVYETVKKAITAYNELIDEMNKLYGADSARGYDPLTSEQKEAMTEEEIKNWEDKIKGSLLRRDNTLGSLLTGLRNSMGGVYTDEDNNKYSLSALGINTGNYTEKGKLHIYGDADDAIYATDENKLKKALEENPDKVMEALTRVFNNVYATMSEKCSKTELRSALTFYNDKQYTKNLKSYEKDLKTVESRIKDMEDKYYKQFTAMETMLSKLQSQTNALVSMLGTSQK